MRHVWLRPCARDRQIGASRRSAVECLGGYEKCPACGETIKSIALRCRYCGTEFSSVDPLSVSELRQQTLKGQQAETFKICVVGAFIASLTGCLAPVSLIFGLVYLLPRRERLAKAGPLFSIMGWTSIALSGLYCVAVLVLFLASQ